MTASQGKPRFIRKNGKIIPIGAKKKGGRNTSSLEKRKRRDRAAIAKKLGDADKKLSATGRFVGNISGLGAAGSIASGLLAKTGGGKRLLGGSMLGMFSVLNHSFAAGRAGSAKDHYAYAKQLRKGSKIKRPKNSLIGPAAERANRNAKILSKMNQKDLNYFKDKTGV